MLPARNQHPAFASEGEVLLPVSYVKVKLGRLVSVDAFRLYEMNWSKASTASTSADLQPSHDRGAGSKYIGVLLGSSTSFANIICSQNLNARFTSNGHFHSAIAQVLLALSWPIRGPVSTKPPQSMHILLAYSISWIPNRRLVPVLSESYGIAYPYSSVYTFLNFKFLGVYIYIELSKFHHWAMRMRKIHKRNGPVLSRRKKWNFTLNLHFCSPATPIALIRTIRNC